MDEPVEITVKADPIFWTLVGPGSRLQSSTGNVVEVLSVRQEDDALLVKRVSS